MSALRAHHRQLVSDPAFGRSRLSWGPKSGSCTVWRQTRSWPNKGLFGLAPSSGSVQLVGALVEREIRAKLRQGGSHTLCFLRVVHHGFERFLRFVLRWYFAILFFVCLTGTFEAVRDAILGEHNSRSLLSQVLHVSIPLALAAIFGMASLTIWLERDSAKAFVIAACLANLAVSISVPLLIYYRWGAGAFWQWECVFGLPTAIGVAGLVFFSPPDKQQRASTKAHKNWAGGRIHFAGLFALTSLGCLGYSAYEIYRYHAAMPIRMQLGLLFYSALAIIFGAAWWSIWREKPSADSWGIAASFIYALMCLKETITSRPPDLAHNVAHNVDWLFKSMGGLVFGTLGLIVFSHYYRQDDSIKSSNGAADHLSRTPNQWN